MAAAEGPLWSEERESRPDPLPRSEGPILATLTVWKRQMGGTVAGLPMGGSTGLPSNLAGLPPLLFPLQSSGS